VTVLTAFGPLGIFLLSIIDAVGVPIPAAMDVLLIGVAAGSADQPSRAYLAALLATVGSTGGNVVLFLAARQGRKWLTRDQTAPAKRRRFGEWFDRYGLLSVFVPAVTPIPLPLKVFVISAGALHTPIGKFTGVVLLARTVRYFGEAFLGLKLGQDAQGFLTRNGWSLAGGVLAMCLFFYWLARLNDRRRASAL
jgi:membrane protein YqaA with SNARE-associated domain